MLKKLIESLKLPEVQEISDLDDLHTTEIHSNVIRSKPFLYQIYLESYKVFGQTITRRPNGKFVELGSGGGFIKEIYPNVVITDILPFNGLDVVFSAEHMPFENNSLDGIFMIDVLHHIKDVENFFQEAQRCLKVGGEIVMIEPANTWWGRFIYTNFHHEPFEPNVTDWKIKGTSPMSCANGALPWILFSRDKVHFQEKFPNLLIEKVTYHTPLRYLISGGVSFKQLLPTFTYSIVKGIEFIFSPLNSILGMFMTIRLKRN